MLCRVRKFVVENNRPLLGEEGARRIGKQLARTGAERSHSVVVATGSRVGAIYPTAADMSKDDTDSSAPTSPSHDVEIKHGDVLPSSNNAVVLAHLAPAVVPARFAATRGRSRWKAMALMGIVIIGACGGAAYWWHTRQGGLPLGIVSGNGRIEADEIDIDTKFAGRIVEMDADEGDLLTPQQVVARMDTRDIDPTLKKSEAQVEAAQQSLHETRADVIQQTTQVTLGQQQFYRTSALTAQGFATKQLLDERQQTLNGATAALSMANDRVGEAARTLDAATHRRRAGELDALETCLRSSSRRRPSARSSLWAI